MKITIFDVIADPTRRKILEMVRIKERSVGELVQLTGLSQPGVSKHLRILREVGLVEVRQEAQKHLYRLHASPLRKIDQWLEPYRRFWEENLPSLDHFLEKEEE